VNSSLFAGTTALTQTSGYLNVYDATTDVSQATVNITAADAASTSTTVANGQVFITGTPTANSAASFAINGESEVHVQMTGNLVGTIVIESSQDGGTTWVARPLRLDGTSYLTASITGASSPLTNFIGHATASALTNVRVRCTAFTSGTGTVLLRSSNFPGSTVVLNPLALHDVTNQGNTAGIGPTWGTAYTTNGTQNVNASLAVGTTMVSGSAPIPISATTAANSSGNPIYVSAAISGTPAVTVSGTATTTPAAGTYQGVSAVTGSASVKTAPIYIAVADGTNVSVMAATGTAPATSTYSLPVAAVLYAGATPTAIGTPVAFGTGTPAGTGLGTNSALYVGTTPVRTNQTTTATGAVDVNLVGAIGSTLVTATTGVLKVGVVGNAGAVFDQVVGSAVPANAIQIGASDGTNLQALSTNVKGTQGARGLAVQELKDAGRSYLTFTATAAAGVTSETLLSLSQNLAGTVTAAVTSYTIPSGKTLRLQNASYSVRAGAAAVPYARLTLRSNTSGATTATSAVVYQFPEVFGISATTGVGGQYAVDIPDGLEIVGNGTITIGVSHLDQATTNVINFTLCGYLY
jgi:hypothetical protein